MGYDEEDESTDRGAMNSGYVAITPIQLDCTAYSAMEELRQKFGLDTSYTDDEAYRIMIKDGMNKKDALQALKSMNVYYSAGWKALLNVKEEG